MNYHKPCLPALFWKLVDRNACWVIKATLRSTQGRWFSYMAAALPWSRPCCGKKSISVGLCYRYQRWDETSTSSGPRSRGRRGGLECVGHVHFFSHDLMSLFFFFFFVFRRQARLHPPPSQLPGGTAGGRSARWVALSGGHLRSYHRRRQRLMIHLIRWSGGSRAGRRRGRGHAGVRGCRRHPRWALPPQLHSDASAR